jgi:hypothetical protein
LERVAHPAQNLFVMISIKYPDPKAIEARATGEADKQPVEEPLDY